MNTTDECFRIAGATVRVEWGDPGVREKLHVALAHRREAPAAADLVIAAGRRAARAPVGASSGLLMHDAADGLAVDEPERGLAHRLDAGGTRATFACVDPRSLPVAECAAPFRLILQRWLRARGVHLLHAAAVGLPGRGAVLLVAPGGGGKSNTFLACLTAPALQLLGEDFVAVDGAAAGPRVWSLYSPAKLHPADLARFPALAADVAPGRDERDDKVLLDLNRRHAARFADGLPLRAILVLKIAGRPASRIVPAPPGEAVKAMLTSLLMVLPAARRPLFEFTTQLVRQVPAYRLELGTDLGQIAATIQDFLSRASP